MSQPNTTVAEAVAVAEEVVHRLDPPPPSLADMAQVVLAREHVLAERTAHYGLIVGITDRGTVDVLVQRWPAAPSARALRKAAARMETQALADGVPEAEVFEQHLDTQAGGGW